MFPGRGQAWTTHHLLTLHTQTSLNWGKSQPCSVFGTICHCQGTVSPWTIHGSDTTSPLATKTFGDHLEPPLVLTVTLRDPAIDVWWAKLRWGAQPCHCSPVAPWTLLTPQLCWTSPPGALVLLAGGWLPAELPPILPLTWNFTPVPMQLSGQN